MNTPASETIVGEWATGLFAQSADDLLITCLEAAQQIQTISPNPEHTLEIEEITTRHTPTIDPNLQDFDTYRLTELLNTMAPKGYVWGAKNEGDGKKIGYWLIDH